MCPGTSWSFARETRNWKLLLHKGSKYDQISSRLCFLTQSYYTVTLSPLGAKAICVSRVAVRIQNSDLEFKNPELQDLAGLWAWSPGSSVSDSANFSGI